MPLHRFECFDCRQEFERLVPMNFRNPNCGCGGPTRKLMPNRVRGWVKSEESAAIDRSERILADIPAPPSIAKPRDPEDPMAIPSIDHGPKDYADCSAAEKDERWAETKEAMIQWQTNCLVESGTDYVEAKAKAKDFQDTNIPKTRADSEL